MKKINILLLSVLVLFSVLSCEDDPILDTKPGDSFTEAAVYSDIRLTESLVFQSYNTLDGWLLGDDWWAARCGIEVCSDEAMFHWKEDRYKIFSIAYPTHISSSSYGLAFEGMWQKYFRHIRNTDVFLSKIDDSPVMKSGDVSVSTKAKHLKGEMKYLRARSYFTLTNYFGSVPYIENPFNLGDDYAVSRASYEKIITEIIADLDEAITLLPSMLDGNYRNASNFGRIHQEAAAALKSRVLLYAASDLHNAGNFENSEFFEYNVGSKWTDAATAAKQAIDMAHDAGLALVQTGSDAKAYQDMFLSNSSELIFGRTYNSTFGTYSADLGSFGLGIQSLPDFAQGASGDGFWACSQPSHNFAMSFKKTDGTRLADDVMYDVDEFYADRDPRFYANITSNGDQYRGREIEMWTPNGWDSKDRPMPTGGHASLTGYFMRKFQDESLSIEEVTTSASESRPYPLARLSELYLNYAEALYRTGDETQAKVYLKMVTDRVDMPEVTASGADLLQAIKDERSWELCFEGHRFFDLRRWMDVDEMSENLAGIQWKKVAADGETLDENGELVGELVLADIREWDPKIYFLPIPQTELDKVSTLVQNPGY